VALVRAVSAAVSYWHERIARSWRREVVNNYRRSIAPVHFNGIRPGDLVTYTSPQGTERAGRAQLFRCSCASRRMLSLDTGWL
jgi:hypothetical protein